LDQQKLRRWATSRELIELATEIGAERYISVHRNRVPAIFDGDAGGNAAAGEEIQHRRAGIGKRKHQPLDQLLRLLGWMADPLLRIAVEARNLPDIGGVDALFQARRIEPLVALVNLKRLPIERAADRVEIKKIFRRPGKPGDLLMPVGEETLRAHAVRIIPDDEIGEQHAAMRAHPAH